MKRNHWRLRTRSCVDGASAVTVWVRNRYGRTRRNAPSTGQSLGEGDMIFTRAGALGEVSRRTHAYPQRNLPRKWRLRGLDLVS
jgi:hypothetical protein